MTLKIERVGYPQPYMTGTTEKRTMSFVREDWDVMLDWRKSVNQFDGEEPEAPHYSVSTYIIDQSNGNRFQVNCDYKTLGTRDWLRCTKQAADASWRTYDFDKIADKFDRVVWDYFTSSAGQTEMMKQTLAACQEESEKLQAQQTLINQQVEIIAAELAAMGLGESA